MKVNILKPGCRMLISDVVAVAELPDQLRELAELLLADCRC
jgi:hypothetical protein